MIPAIIKLRSYFSLDLCVFLFVCFKHDGHFFTHTFPLETEAL